MSIRMWFMSTRFGKPIDCHFSLWVKPTDALNSNFIGITTLHVSGSLSAHHQEFLAVHRLWYILCSCDDHLQFHPAPGSKRLPQLHKMYQSRCTAKNSWWWAERLPETCTVVITIKLEFSASVGFIHKEFVTMHSHTIVKWLPFLFLLVQLSCLQNLPVRVRRMLGRDCEILWTPLINPDVAFPVASAYFC